MAIRSVSPLFAGRDAELAALLSAYGRAPSVVLVGGEAGAGKTRLVDEFAERVSGEALVLTGGCLEFSSGGLPYAPFTAGLRRLTREIGAAEVSALVPGGSHELGRLLPELGPPPARPDDVTASSHLFEEVLGLLERLAERRPVVLVVEDAHWADRSSRDLLTFLTRNLTRARVLVVVTYRSDDLHRGHPMRPVLAELSRGATVLHLPRLSLAEVTRQLTGILGHEPDPALAERVHARSEGIPLFVEELVRSADGPLPESLRDLLLAGFDALPAATRDVIRLATVNGSHTDHALLAAVTGLGDAGLSDAIRPAVETNVLVTDDTGYAFRHALIRQAIRTDLLPGERTRFHRAFAEALERDPSLGTASELAEHWHHARDEERALDAAWRAAEAAEKAYAYAERLEMLERVLDLWTPAAAERIGADRVAVLDEAAEAARVVGEHDRGLKLVREALSELDGERDPERLALLLFRRSKLRSDRGLAGELDDLERALALATGPSLTRAQVLAQLGGLWGLQSRPDRAQPYLDEALELADRLGAVEVRLNALMSRAGLDNLAGRSDEALRDYREARATAERLGMTWLVLRALVNEIDVLAFSGRLDEAMEVAHQAIELSRRHGRIRTHAVFGQLNLAEAQLAAGRIPDAAKTLDELLELPPEDALHADYLIYRARAALAMGEYDRAGEMLSRAREELESREAYTQEILPLAATLIDWHLIMDDPAGAMRVLERARRTRDLRLSPRFGWEVLTSGLRAALAAGDDEVRRELTDLAAVLPAPGPVSEARRRTFHALLTAAAHQRAPAVRPGEDDTARAVRPGEGDAAQAVWPGGEDAARAVRAGEADAARAVRPGGEDAAQGVRDGGDAAGGVRGDLAGGAPGGVSAEEVVTAWDAAAEAWARAGRPLPRASAVLEAARAAAGHDREGAAERLRAAAELADGTGAEPLVREIAGFARRARIPLDTAAGAEPAERERLGLTEREYEVLRHLADGRTNREIAADLFISAKTVSVHVSNILTKLDVSTRGEAAALAHRLNLFPS
ncbi:helix-turn-helix transcriptional regulator [Bailinhaonella thermotolerans]|uniref:Helix-turn-helix transcriptional regulator n=1 Tax=Bailinhaonella thermotolerans TaxID=1070861 RepID=A0A3A4BG14_9ACTN|nr:helix-turn-helix transcriptional regulator [Bailinhaonella thermotolerans]RJL33432.1 helix-turn-helix transcriptional regulator [Bailinhaonella thermotolerans]